MSKIKKNEIFFSFCEKNDHENSKNSFLCLEPSCFNSKTFGLCCKFCVFGEHSHHKIIQYRDFLKKIEVLFHEALTKLPKIIECSKNNLFSCENIEETLIKLIKTIIITQKQINIYKTNLSKKIDECENLFKNLKKFDKEYFVGFYPKKTLQNFKIPLEKLGEINSKITINEKKNVFLLPEYVSLLNDHEEISTNNLNDLQQTLKNLTNSLTNEKSINIFSLSQAPPPNSPSKNLVKF